MSSRFLTSLLLLVLAGSSVSAQNVRIRILDLASPTRIELSGPGLQLFAGDFEEPITRLGAGDIALVSLASNQLHVAVGETALYANALRVESIDSSGFGLAVREDRSTREAGTVRQVGTVREGDAAHERHTYAGRLYISTDPDEWEMRLINEVPMEEYVASVVSSEYGFDDLEGSKAMAVIVRTYTLAVFGKYGSEYDHVDHTLSQVYRGSDDVTDVARLAAEETAGQVLKHNGELIRAVYFAASGGHTADNEDVWEGDPVPYLRGRPDPYGESSPHARWTTRISRQELLQRLSEAYGAVEGFVLAERSREGRVRSVELLQPGGRRHTISANEFRILVIKHFGPRSLRSALFDARRQGNEYVFEGSGYGHGVGLSQWGARDMAQRGQSYEDILRFYYTDVELATLDETPAPPEPTVPVASQPQPEEPPSSSRRIGW